MERKTTLGQRIRLCRAAAGLSLRELEAKIGRRVTAQAINAYERDIALPRQGVLFALADAFGVPLAHLAEGREMILTGVEFRGKTLPTQKEETRIKARVALFLDRYLQVEQLLGLPSGVWDKPHEAPWPVLRDLAEAEYAARGVRAHWGLGFNPIPNLAELLQQHGIKVLDMDIAAADGLMTRARLAKGGALPVIVVHGGHGGERQRFTLAHELGHLVLDVAADVDGEQAAQRFAAAFLMPAETLHTEIGRRRKAVCRRELLDLKRIFGVSLQALLLRCRELGIFGPVLFQRLLAEYGLRGWGRPPYREPCAMEKEKTRRFERLCLRALSEGELSAEEAAGLLEVPADDLNRLMEEPEAKPAGTGD